MTGSLLASQSSAISPGSSGALHSLMLVSNERALRSVLHNEDLPLSEGGYALLL